MDTLISERLDLQDQKLNLIHESVEKTRKYLLVIMWSSLAMIVLPVIIALLIAPAIISSYTSTLEGLSL